MLFAEPRIGKVRVGKLEENSSSHRNCTCLFSLGWLSSCAVDMLYSLVFDPVNAAVMWTQGLFRWSLYMFTEQNRYIVTHMCRAM